MKSIKKIHEKGILGWALLVLASISFWFSFSLEHVIPVAKFILVLFPVFLLLSNLTGAFSVVSLIVEAMKKKDRKKRYILNHLVYILVLIVYNTTFSWVLFKVITSN